MKNRTTRALSSIGIRLLAGLVSGALFASDIAAQRQAVEQTLASNAACQSLGDFYWEIGDGNGAQASGQVGQSITASGVIRLASASKWVFGSYMAQKTGGHFTQVQLDALQMRSGYDEMSDNSCALATTIDGCLTIGSNGTFDAPHAGYFSYNGGHDEELAHKQGLGGLSITQLTQDLQQTLGADLGISYDGPQPAGGMAATPAAYGAFLRKIINGQLVMSSLLGSAPVCTLPAVCPQAVSSPSPYAWHYSINHWVEDGPGQDGAFSSPGKFGFYPWITADHKHYGIVARVSTETGAFLPSAQCGAAIRAAWTNAGSYTAQVSSSGPLTSQTLSAALTPATADLGKTGAIFIAAVVNNAQYVLTPSGWQTFNAANPAPYYSGSLHAINANLVNAADLAPLVGTTIYLGYGVGGTAQASLSAMTSNALLVQAYTIH